MSKMEPMTWYGRYLSEHSRCRQLQQENERLKVVLDTYGAIEENGWDLQCVDTSTDGGIYDVQWRVIEHYMAEPTERIIGYGTTSLEALEQALDNSTPGAPGDGQTQT